MYYKDVLKNAKPVSLLLENVDVIEALNVCLKDQRLSYNIEDRIIVIKTKLELIEFAQTPPPVTGVVRGPDGQPIAGVNVVVKGTKKGVVTDAYGRFSIEAEQGKTLVISNIGYNARRDKSKWRE